MELHCILILLRHRAVNTVLFANAGDAVCTLTPEELPADIMDGMDIFYNDMFSPKAAIWLAEKALEQGKPVIYNMQCVPSFMETCGD